MCTHVQLLQLLRDRSTEPSNEAATAAAAAAAAAAARSATQMPPVLNLDSRYSPLLVSAISKSIFNL